MAVLSVKMFVVGPIQTNCYFLRNTETDQVIVVDPGAYGKKLAQEVINYGLTPVAILLTHCHFDHVDGVKAFQESFDDEIPVYILDKEKEGLENPMINLSAEMSYEKKSYEADVFVHDGQTIELADFSIEVFHTPGHTKGGCCYYIADQKALFSGDTLFQGSVGRTDFPGGDMSELLRSVKDRLLVLPDDVRVYPGHESITSIGNERKYNIYIA